MLILEKHQAGFAGPSFFEPPFMLSLFVWQRALKNIYLLTWTSVCLHLTLLCLICVAFNNFALAFVALENRQYSLLHLTISIFPSQIPSSTLCCIYLKSKNSNIQYKLSLIYFFVSFFLCFFVPIDNYSSNENEHHFESFRSLKYQRSKIECLMFTQLNPWVQKWSEVSQQLLVSFSSNSMDSRPSLPLDFIQGWRTEFCEWWHALTIFLW